YALTPPAGCGTVIVKLWGGGGSSSSNGSGTPGHGCAGGYVYSEDPITGALALHVGRGATGCGSSSAGTNAGSSSLNGGAGQTGGSIGDANKPGGNGEPATAATLGGSGAGNGGDG